MTDLIVTEVAPKETICYNSVKVFRYSKEEILIDETTIYVRPSTVTSHALCPARTGLRAWDGFNHYPNEALLFGSLMHWMIELTLKGIQFSDRDALYELTVLFVKDIPDSTENVTLLKEVTSPNQRQALVTEATEAWSVWNNTVLPLLPKEDPVVEKPLSMTLRHGTEGHETIVLRGTPDVVYPETGLIIDWKTAGRNWSDDKAEGQLQRVGYPMMALADKGWDITDFHFWVFDRSSGRWNIFRTSTGPVEAESAFISNALQAAQNEIHGIFTYTPSGGGFKARGWHCSPKYCDAWSCCEGKFLVADGQANEPALTLKERWS